ncbi:fungal-specific transcription factor domain-containing protein [Xylogone sp. PMI_703]|nr:fungal-specific transcription factor domain-containing protein [Xylogone sp. PMI_703]
MDFLEGRKYKSRKQRPCDACRRRKTCCVREAGSVNCKLCISRSRDCRFESVPKARPRRSPNSRFAIGIDQDQIVLATHKQTTVGDKNSTWRMQHVGLSSDQDPWVFQHCSFNHLDYFRRPDWVCLRVKKGGFIPMLFTVVPDNDVDTKPLNYPASTFDTLANQHERALLQSYFGIVNAAFPLFDPARFASGHVESKLLRAAMFALATPFCQEAKHIPLSEYHTFILQALPIDTRYPRLETVEAALLFFQRHTVLNSATTTPGEWSDVGSMVGMAQELALNIDPTPWNISKTDRNRRIRIWWAVYTQERWSAFALGRSPNINEDYCTTPMITLDNFSNDDFATVSDVTLTSARIFVGIVELTKILSELIKKFYTIKGIGRLQELAAQELYAMVEDYDEHLCVFQREHLEPLSNVDTILDSTGTIFLAFYTLEIVLCRGVLRNINREDPGYPPFRSRARDVVRKVVMLLAQLQVNRLRAFWWSPMSRICFAVAGSFMYSNLLTSVDDDEVEYWSREVDQYRRLLEMHSVSFDITKLAAARMSLLASASQEYDESGENVGLWDVESILKTMQ